MPEQLDTVGDVRSLLASAQKITMRLTTGLEWPPAGVDTSLSAAAVAARLNDSVIRPLVAALSPVAAPQSTAVTGTPGDAADPSEAIWQLAQQGTWLCCRPGLPPEIQEATAALQDLACRLAPAEGPDSAAARLDELRRIQADLPSGIRAATDGPYLVTNLDRISNWLGEDMPTRPQLALCRCGASASKPLCDGSHARVGFHDGKDPERVPDRLDTYQGQQVTVLDNRGTCAHSGLCTDRLATAFRVDKEPFVAPSGGRMDEIIRAVRACPSGALSYAVDGREAREQVDQDREPAIEVSKDGPYRVVGGLPLTDGAGHPVARNQGASLEHYSLCRCGHSRNKPFCSGMHYYVGFADPQVPGDQEPTLFAWAGGLPALTRMTRIFYEKYVPEDPLIGPLFASMSPDHAERVAAWLGEVFGGPKFYSRRYGGYDRMISQHVNRSLTEEQRARWVQLISRSADDARLPADAEFRAALVAYLEWGSRIAVENATLGAHPPGHMPVPRWWWVCHATPGARVSALADPEPSKEPDMPATLPSATEPLGFEQHIKSLFRNTDRQSMRFAFDLWSHQDVTQHASAILTRLAEGTMPCDAAWPEERVAVFRRWIESGMAP